mgnify:CR=1 FL=1
MFECLSGWLVELWVWIACLDCLSEFVATPPSLSVVVVVVVVVLTTYLPQVTVGGGGGGSVC